MIPFNACFLRHARIRIEYNATHTFSPFLLTADIANNVPKTQRATAAGKSNEPGSVVYAENSLSKRKMRHNHLVVNCLLLDLNKPIKLTC